MLIDDLAVLLTVIWASWCVMSVNVQDGVVGRIAYSAVAIFGSVILLQPPQLALATTAYHVSFALLALRHYVLTMHWEWFRALLIRFEIVLPHNRRKEDAS